MNKKWITSNLLKRVKKILTCPPDLRYQDVKIILQAFGFEETTQQGGSHRVFILVEKREGVIYEPEDLSQLTVPVKKGRRVKRVYLKKIIECLHLEEWYEKHKKK